MGQRGPVKLALIAILCNGSKAITKMSTVINDRLNNGCSIPKWLKNYYIAMLTVYSGNH